MRKFFLIFCAMAPYWSFAQFNYPSYDALLNRINQLKGKKNVAVESVGKSFGGENIPVIKIEQDKKAKPTLLVVAGIDGKHPAGVVGSLEVVDRLTSLAPDSLNRLLSGRSVWIIPLVNPDAYKRNSKTGHWLSGNARVVDNDRDGRVDEDPAKDLNGDGVIAQMRVKRAGGTYRVHPTFKDILVQADRSKGEKGEYLLLTEGIDADFDGKYGEDGEGGVNIDRNFTFDYPAFVSESGEYAASEPETRALVDFIFANPQIWGIVHFGLTNNLSEPEKYNPAKARERIISSWSESDAEVSKYVSTLYKEAVKGLGEAPRMEHKPGNFVNTAYYHLGKFSFATPLWWPVAQDSSKKVKPEDVFYHWVSKNNVAGAILPWTKVQHPSFPNQEVEVGGIVEIFKNNPPVQFLSEPAKLHANFVSKLIDAMPQLVYEQPVVTPLGGDVYRVELTVTNVGKTASYPEIADKIKFIPKFKTVCELQKNQQFLNGKRLQLYSSLGAGQSLSFSWLIKGKGTVSITAGCPSAGEIKMDVKL